MRSALVDHLPLANTSCHAEDPGGRGGLEVSKRQLPAQTARLLEEHGAEILGVYALPDGHRKRMQTTNMLERQNEELKRRTRLVRVIPNRQSCLRLVSARLMETRQEWMGRLYLRLEEETADQIPAQADYQVDSLRATHSPSTNKN